MNAVFTVVSVFPVFELKNYKGINVIDDKGVIKIEIRVSRNDKGFVIGRGGEKIKIYKEILKRVHNISDIQVK